MKIDPITENDLSEYAEYSVSCERCDSESTRDSFTFAPKIANQEGFALVNNAMILCRHCIRESQEAR